MKKLFYDDFIASRDSYLGAESGESQFIYDPPEPDLEIIVSAKFLRMPSDGGGGSSGGFNLAPWFYGTHYGPNTGNDRPFIDANTPVAIEPSEIVSRAAEAMAEAIKTLTDLARPVLPRAEEARLDALSASLEATANAIKIGQIDLSTAHTLVQTALATGLDAMSGAAIGIAFAAIGTYAGSATGNLAATAAIGGGFGALGLWVDWQISDTGLANSFATKMTDAIFNGANALANFMNDLYDSFNNSLDYFDRFFEPPPLFLEMQLESNGVFGEFDGYSGNGNEAYVGVHYNGGANLSYSTNSNGPPPYWGGNTGPGPKEPPMPIESDIQSYEVENDDLAVRGDLMTNIVPAMIDSAVLQFA